MDSDTANHEPETLPASARYERWNGDGAIDGRARP
jgi:hypothetical protein